MVFFYRETWKFRMDKVEISYCRFCAEPRNSDKLLNLIMDVEKCEETALKLAFLNALYVDISDNILPKTICFVCYDSLNKAYEFLNKVKDAQEVILTLFDQNKDSKYDLTEDDRFNFDDSITTETDNKIKEESSTIKQKVKPDNLEAAGAQINIKIEPKDEFDCYGAGEDAHSMDGSTSPQNFEDNLNVQDIIDAAISGTPLTSNMTIYEKVISDISKKEIASWKEYPWLCAHCNIEFQDIATLRKHSKIVHGKCSAFTCVDCKTFTNDSFLAFVKHVRRHRRSLKKYCYYCDTSIQNSEELKIHIDLHFLKSQVPCSACGEILKNEETLKTHLLDYNTAKPKRKPRRKRGTPITVADLTCNICHKVYKNPNSLRDHKKLHRSDRKRDYTCDRCGKTFYSKGTLTSHIMSHDKIRPHICRICNKSFLFPNMLRRHVEMHSGVKPFSCEQCGRCFRLQYQLNAHKIVHTDAMPYVCQYCSKAFRFKQILKNHERQHTGAKPYSCQQCGMEFTNWSNYNKHMKRRHGTDTSKKKITPDGVFPVNPETGLIVQVHDAGTEEWKSKIMVPCKRGKKKIKKEDVD